MRVLILGAGDHGQVTVDALLQSKNKGVPIKIVGYLDDDLTLLGKKYLGIPVLGTLEQRQEFNYDGIIVAIGQNSIRARIFDQIKQEGERVVNVIHPAARIAFDVKLGNGITILAGAIVNTGTVVEDNVILNTACSVDHHGFIGKHAHLAPGVHLGGRVTIGEGTLVGVGAAVIPGQQIGKWSVIGSGSCVISKIPDFVTVVGTPAKIIENR